MEDYRVTESDLDMQATPWEFSGGSQFFSEEFLLSY